MARTRKTSSLLSKYSKLYEKNPRSRVFAPLAESYRKLGMVEEALSILKEGIKRHPTYVMGYTVLANCHYDLENYELAYNTIRPFVSDNLENISLQKLFAKICVNLGYLEEALQTFKYLLLINPKDSYVSEQVKLLEDDLIINELPPQTPPETGPASFSESEDEWVQVDFNKGPVSSAPDELDSWNMERPRAKTAEPAQNPLSSFRDAIKKNDLKIEEHSLDDDYYYEEYDDENAAKVEEQTPEEPIITHTLVDLYIRQGHLDKAAKLLESILELHPDDGPTAKKLAEIKGKEALPSEVEEEKEEAPDLAYIVEEKTRDGRDRSLKMLENKLNIFLEKIKREGKRRLEAQ